MPPNPNEQKALTQFFKIGAPKVDLKKPKGKELERQLESFGKSGWPVATDVLKTFGPTLTGLATDAAGGVYAEWALKGSERPIVYFGTEGNVEVAAASLRELLGMLPFRQGEGWTLKDAMGHSRAMHLDLDEASAARTPLAIDARAVEDADLAAILADSDIPLVPAVSERVAAASAKYLWTLVDKLDQIVTGYKSTRMWRDAFNGAQPTELRPFSPRETYRVGEKVTLVDKGSDSLMKALVLALPRPDRVLLCFHGATFVRACGA